MLAIPLEGCELGTEPESGTPTTELSFVQLAASAPAPVTFDTSFWAVRGDHRRLEIRTESSEEDEDGEEFFEFNVPGDALLRYPDGRLFAEDDSVQIRVRVQEGRFLFDFEPSGLRFDPRHPAELRVRYGDADEEDLEREAEFALWKQEAPNQPWFRQATVRMDDLDELRADIASFTAFALATD
jgi:hypothetical protein